jgi:dienelactone hydrolase
MVDEEPASCLAAQAGLFGCAHDDKVVRCAVRLIFSMAWKVQRQEVVMSHRRTCFAFALVCFAVMATGSWAVRAATVVNTQVIDLTKIPVRGLPRSLEVVLYRNGDSTEKQSLIILVPQYAAHFGESPYREQAEYFVSAGYAAAIPHFDIYADANHTVVSDLRRPTLQPDLAAESTTYAIQLLAVVATLSQPNGPISSKHVIVGEGYGGIIAARYAALGPPGCKGLVMISPGHTFSPRANEDAYKELGGKVTIPSFWVYTNGDKGVGNELFDAFKSVNSLAKVEVLPDAGVEGRLLFSKGDAQTSWGAPVSKFLGSLDVH